MRLSSFLKPIIFAASLILFVTSCSTPKPQTATSEPASAMKSELPVIPPAKLFQHQEPLKYTLDNGMPVWYLYNPIVPLMSMKIAFNAGSYLDPSDKAGRAALTAAMLKEGSNGKTAQMISDEIEMLGATLYTSTSQDSVSLDLQAMTRFFPDALNIIEEVWLKPDFTQSAFDRLKNLWISNLIARADSPEQLAKLAGNRDFFGDDHPYAVSTDGYIDTIPAITIEDLKSYYAQAFTPSNATIIITGSIPADDLIHQLNEHFGKLPRVPSDLPPCKIPDRKHETSVVIVDKPDAPQTVIRIALPSVVSSDPRLLSLKLVNIPFGGSFTSRLMQNIREDKGYTYGAYSVISPLKEDGFMIAQAAVSSDVTGAALKEFLYEFDRLSKGDFTQDEFDRAKATWQSELVQTFETQSGALSTLVSIVMNGLEVNTINRFAKTLPNVTLDDFNQTARTFPTLDTMSITLVGDKNLILEQIKDLGLPTPTFRDTQGFLIP